VRNSARIGISRASRGLVLAGIVVFTAASAGAAGSIEDLQYEGRVVVTADGNGMIDTRFPTTVDGEDVKYYLDVHNARPAVRALNVTLNGEVVFQKAAFARERVEIALHLAGTTDNELRVSADGERGSAADFAILAVRPAADRGQDLRP
jgi:hypothetical protein